MKTQVELSATARSVRRRVLQMVHQSGSSHVGSALSIVDVLVYLYSNVFFTNDAENPHNLQRERFLLSKGHACSALYATLAEFGYFDKTLLDTYAKNGSSLMAHVSSMVPGVEFSTGSLGHALPVGVGMARAAKVSRASYGVTVLLSDGELNEGSNWEAFMIASQLQLGNLCVVIDKNGLQALGKTGSIINLDPLEERLSVFGFDTVRVDGHDFSALERAFRVRNNPLCPKCVILDTVKGKGVSFMENSLAWHYKSPNSEQLAAALAELEDGHA